MSVDVYTSDPTGGGRAPLSSVGTVTGLTWGSNIDGGDTSCSFSISVPIDAQPGELRPGRLLTVVSGPTEVWAGLVADPQRGTPWTVTGQSLGSTAGDYLALDGTGPTAQYTSNLNTAIDAAIGRGWPVARAITLPTPTVAPSSPSIADLLAAVATASGTRWSIRDGKVALTTDPTVPTYRLTSVDKPGGRTVDNYVTDAYSLFTPPVASTSGGITKNVPGPRTLVAATTNPPLSAPRPFGRREAIYDATALGMLTSGDAAILANGVLAKSQAEPVFSGSMSVLPGTLTTMGGQPVDLTTIRAGFRMVVVGAQPDPLSGSLTSFTNIEITCGDWQFNATTGVGTLLPVGGVKRDLSSLLRAAAAITTTPAAKQNPWGA
jgi:hypothetical protein